MVAAYVQAVWAVFVELAPWLLLGAAVSGLIHGLLPPGFVHRQLSGRFGVLKAVALGIPMPLCSCGVIPAGLGLRRDGASAGASVGFITATPQTGVDSILVSASFLGWPFALAKVVAALVTGVASGWATDALGDAGSAAEEPGAHSAHTDGRGLRAMIDHGVDLIRMIWGWLVAGVLVSAALTTLLPPDLFGTLSAGSSLAAYALVLVVSLPLYVCATASVPIAAALVAAGLPSGAAMVFLMAGPATNVATLAAVRGAFGLRTTAVYVASLVAGSLAFGLGYDAVLGAITVESVHAHTHAAAWWEQASAVGLLGLLSWFAWEDVQGWLRARRVGSAPVALEVGVEGMTCNGCRSRLERTLLAADGIESASVVLEPGEARVTGSVSEAELKALIEGAGFSMHPRA